MLLVLPAIGTANANSLWCDESAQSRQKQAGYSSVVVVPASHHVYKGEKGKVSTCDYAGHVTDRRLRAYISRERQEQSNENHWSGLATTGSPHSPSVPYTNVLSARLGSHALSKLYQNCIRNWPMYAGRFYKGADALFKRGSDRLGTRDSKTICTSLLMRQNGRLCFSADPLLHHIERSVTALEE